MNIQRGRGQVHAADEIEGYMPTPKCGGNRSAEGYRETSIPVTCKNCLKILAKEAEAEQAYQARLAASLAPASEGGHLGDEHPVVVDERDAGRLSLEEALDAAYERIEQPRGNWGVAVVWKPVYPVDTRLSLADALEEADRHGGLRGWGRAMDAGRLSLADARDLAYEQVKAKFTGEVTFTPVHEQAGEYIEPGTLLRHTRSGQVGMARYEHGTHGGAAWVKVRLVINGELVDDEVGTARWYLHNTVRVPVDSPARLAPEAAGTCCGMTYYSEEALVNHRASRFHQAPELPAGVTMDPATRVLSGTWRGMRDLYESGRASIVDGDLVLR